MSDLRSIAPRAPTVLRSIAVLGVIIAIVGTIVIWIFLSDLEDTTDRSLLIGEQATATLEETIDIADQVLTAVDDGLVTVQSTLRTIDGVLQSTAGVATATGSSKGCWWPGSRSGYGGSSSGRSTSRSPRPATRACARACA